MKKNRLNRLIENFLAIEQEEARKAGALGYMRRALVQATLPHSKVDGIEYVRKNGDFILRILSPSDIGLPYGSGPRLLLAWIATEAIKTKNKQLALGKTFSGFMQEIGLTPKGGRDGTNARIKEQITRLFSSSVSCTYSNGNNWAIKNVTPIAQANLWWNPIISNCESILSSVVILNDEFFNELIDSPIPIDLRVLKEVARSPMAIDIYCWLNYRASYLKRRTFIPWSLLQAQFGSNYQQNIRGLRDFKRAFLREMKKIVFYCEGINADTTQDYLVIKPSNTHIQKSK